MVPNNTILLHFPSDRPGRNIFHSRTYQKVLLKVCMVGDLVVGIVSSRDKAPIDCLML